MSQTTTPITDASAVPLLYIVPPRFPNGSYDLDCKWVPADVSRRLERDLLELLSVAMKYLNVPELDDIRKRIKGT